MNPSKKISWQSAAVAAAALFAGRAARFDLRHGQSPIRIPGDAESHVRAWRDHDIHCLFGGAFFSAPRA